jgi:hypothetical protein
LADSMKTLPFSESHQANFIGKSIALWLFNIDMEAMAPIKNGDFLWLF